VDYKAPNSEAENFSNEFKYNINSTGSSNWDSEYNEMIAYNFHFNFIPKELLYMKNNS
jgi:hypothetical protein